MGRLTRHGLLALLGALMCVGGAWAAEPTAADPASPGYYSRMMRTTEAIEQAGDILMWGRLVERLPARTLGLRLDYRSRRYDSAYGDDNSVGPVIRTLQPRDPFGTDQSFFKLVTEVNGRLQTLDLRVSYGIIDAMTVYADLPLVKQNADLDFDFSPGSVTRLGVRTVEELFTRVYEPLGRPRPKTSYDSVGWDPGDLTAGLLWTYFNGRYVTLTGQGTLVLPTGFVADPDEAQRFGLGAQRDVGQGSVAPGYTQMVHLRLPDPYDWIGLWLEGTGFYYLRHERDTPSWGEVDPAFAGFSGRLELDDDRFIDLSDVDRRYTVTPGAQVESLAAVTFSFHYLTVGLGYFYDYRQQPSIDADQALKRFFEAGDAYPAGDGHALGLQVGVPLSWLRVPGIFNVGYAYPLGGRNSLRLEDRLDLQGVVFFPF